MARKFKTPAWTRKAGKNPKGGLNARGRASYKGGTLKAPVKSGDNPRRASFLARMGNMKGPERDSKGKPTHYAFPFLALLRLLIALAFAFASALDDAPHAFKDSNKRVGLPLLSLSGPFIFPIRAKKLALRGLSPDFTGALSVPPL